VNGQKLIRKITAGLNVLFFTFACSLAKTVVQKKTRSSKWIETADMPVTQQNRLRQNIVINPFAVALLICNTNSPVVAKIADRTGCQ